MRHNVALFRPGRPLLGVLVSLLLIGTPTSGASAQTDAGPGDLDAAAAQGPKKHRKRQGRPIELGTSGGNVNDVSLLSCCGGTLGALLMKEGRYFILSNNHVLARVNQAQAGEAVSQPGPNDLKCNLSSDDTVGTLSGLKKLKFNGNNRVDAAIAETDLNQVVADGALIGIGVPGNQIAKAKLGMEVVKSGRTTAVTRGVVTDLNVTGNVTFPTGCSPDAEEVQIRFSKVMLVESTGNKPFSAGGDSGSVIWEDVEQCPRAVGLLFAGNSLFTAANLMKGVMKAVKKMKPKGAAELVGCDPVTSFGDPWLEDRFDRQERLAMRVQERIENGVLALPGVTAIGIGRAGDSDRVVVRVHMEESRPEIARAIPENIDGVPVELVESGRLHAFYCLDEGPPGIALGGLETTGPR